MTPINPPEDVFNIATTNATNGAPKDVSRFDCSNGAVQCVWTSGAFELHGSMNGADWHVIQGAIGASAVIVLTSFWRFLRIRTVTAGDFEAFLGAHE